MYMYVYIYIYMDIPLMGFWARVLNIGHLDPLRGIPKI